MRIGRVVGGGVALYAAALVLAHLFSRRLLFPAAGRADAPAPAGVELIARVAADGARVHALDVPGSEGAPTVVFFHGNGEVAGDNLPLARELVRRGLHVVLAEYRGYGASSPGEPSEAGLYADAEAILAELTARGVDPRRVCLFGFSLGTGVAVEMARRGHGAALVLGAPYTSIVEVASHHVPFLPVSLLLADRFDSLAKAGELRLPTLVVHGTDDAVVPFAMGRALAARIPGARFVAAEGRHHNDLFGRGELDAAASFVRASIPPP